MATDANKNQPTGKDGMFFFNILLNMTNKPEVDWDMVATTSGYNNASTAKSRFGQLKKKYTDASATGGSGSAFTSPAKPTTPKKAVGSGTKNTPNKIKKGGPGRPKGGKNAAVKADAEAEEQFNVKSEDDELANNDLEHELKRELPKSEDDFYDEDEKVVW